MINRSHENRVALALAVTLPGMVGLWLISGPGAVSPTTYTTATALLVALVGTTITLYRNGGGTGGIRPLLRAAEMAPLAAGSHPVSGSATRSGS